MKTLNGVTKVTDKVCEIVSFFSMAVAVFLCVVLFADVVLRKITALGDGSWNISITGTYEMCQVGLSMFIFSTWAYVQTIHGHIHVVMFIQKFPQKLRFICFAFTSLLSTATMIFAAYGVFFKAMDMMNAVNIEKTSNLGIPFWPFYWFEFAAFVLLAITLFLDAIKAVIAIGNKELAEEIQRDWV